MVRAQNISHSIQALQLYWPTKENGDPTGMMYASDWIMFQNLYSTLVELSSSKTVRPALAERWTQSADGKHWIFYFRKNLRWSDNTPLTTEQIVQSLKRTAKGTYHTKFNAYVESIRASSDTQVEMQLKEKAPRNFLILLAFVDSSILHPKAYASGKFNWYVPNNGPFRIEFYSNTEIKLTANPHYWDNTKDRIQHATLTKVATGNPQKVIKMLLDSHTDATAIDAGIIQNFSQVEELKKKYDVYIGNPEFLFNFNFSKKRTKEGKLNLVFRQYLLKEIYNRFWKADHNNTFRASGLRFHHLRGALSIAQLDEILAKLPDLFNKKVFPKSLEILVRERTKEKPIAIRMLQMVRELGFTVKEITLNAEEHSKRFQSGDFDLELISSGATEDDPDTAWRFYNNSLAEPVATTEELDQAQLEGDPLKRNQMYQSFERKALEQALFIPIKYEPTYIVTSKRVILDSQLAADWGLQLFKLRMRQN